MTTQTESKLRDALRATTGDPQVDRMIHETIRASLDSVELINIYDEEAGPEQAELDLYLTGDGVDDHATSAQLLAAFVAAVSDAVKETAKVNAKRQRYTSNLVIEGIAPGSVRLLLKVADPKLPGGKGVAPGTDASSVDSAALRSVATILTLASSDDLDAPLFGELDRLPLRARQALKRAARTTTRAGWDMDGRIRQRRFGGDDVKFTPAAARRLNTELDSKLTNTLNEVIVGTLDGFRRSLGLVYVVPTSGTPVPVAVIDPELLQQVTRLASDPEAQIAASVTVLETTPKGASPVIRRSRTLESIRQLTIGKQSAIDE